MTSPATTVNTPEPASRMQHDKVSSGHGNLILRKQLMELRKRPVDGFSAGLVEDDNLLEWEVMIIGFVASTFSLANHVTHPTMAFGNRPADTLYEGAFLKARLSFPEDYPLLPPKMRFISEMWHPNIYPDGTVCISILHAPGDDVYGYEDAGERWLPVHTVETVLISVISLLSQNKPDLDSPANVDAAKEVRDDYASYKRKVRRLARKSADEAFD